MKLKGSVHVMWFVNIKVQTYPCDNVCSTYFGEVKCHICSRAVSGWLVASQQWFVKFIQLQRFIYFFTRAHKSSFGEFIIAGILFFFCIRFVWYIPQCYRILSLLNFPVFLWFLKEVIFWVSFSFFFFFFFSKWCIGNWIIEFHN